MTSINLGEITENAYLKNENLYKQLEASLSNIVKNPNNEAAINDFIKASAQINMISTIQLLAEHFTLLPK